MPLKRKLKKKKVFKNEFICFGNYYRIENIFIWKYFAAKKVFV